MDAEKYVKYLIEEGVEVLTKAADLREDSIIRYPHRVTNYWEVYKKQRDYGIVLVWLVPAVETRATRDARLAQHFSPNALIPVLTTGAISYSERKTGT